MRCIFAQTISQFLINSGFSMDTRGPTFQISWSYDLKPRRSEQTNRQTDRQTNKQTDNAIYIVDIFRLWQLLLYPEWVKSAFRLFPGKIRVMFHATKILNGFILVISKEGWKVPSASKLWTEIMDDWGKHGEHIVMVKSQCICWFVMNLIILFVFREGRFRARAPKCWWYSHGQVGRRRRWRWCQGMLPAPDINLFTGFRDRSTVRCYFFAHLRI